MCRYDFTSPVVALAARLLVLALRPCPAFLHPATIALAPGDPTVTNMQAWAACPKHCTLGSTMATASTTLMVPALKRGGRHMSHGQALGRSNGCHQGEGVTSCHTAAPLLAISSQ